jgi:orotate phosphoribosyltransferase
VTAHRVDVLAVARAVEACCRVSAVDRRVPTELRRSYFDAYRLAAEPVLLHDIATLMTALVPAEAEVLAGLELGGIPVAAILSQLTGLPLVMVRATRRPYGTQRLVEGPDCAGRRVVLVSDTVPPSADLRRRAAVVRSLGASTSMLVCAFDRERPAAPVDDQGLAIRVALTREVLTRGREAS